MSVVISDMVALFRADTSSLDRGMVRARAGLQGVEADAAEATRGVNILGTAIDALTVQVARANTQLPGFVLNVRALGRALTTLNGNFDPAIVAAYVAALSSVGGVAATVNADVAGLRTDLAALNRTFGSMAPTNYAGRMGTSSAALAQMQIDLAAAQAQLAQFNATLAQTRAINPRMAINTGGGGGGGTNLNSLGSAGMQIGRTMTRTVTTPILAAGAAFVYLSTQFEAATMKWQTLAGVGKKDADEWSKAILKLGPEIGQSPIALAQSMFRVASEGLRGAKALEVLTDAGKMSAIQMGKTEDLAYSLSVILHDYAGSNMTAAHAADVLVRATSVGNFNTATLVSNLGKLLPLASQMHVPFEQIAGAIAAMTREGATVPQSVTAIASMLRTFEHPSVAVYKALHAIGLSAAEVRHQMGSDLLGALLRVQAAAKGNEVAFAKVFPNVRAFTAALSILGANSKDARQQFDDVAHGTNNLGTAFDKNAHTKLFTFQQAMASLTAAGIKFGDAMAPEILMVTKAINALAGAMSNLTPGTQRTIVVLAGLLAMVGPLTTAIGFLDKTTVFFNGTLVRMGYSTGAATGGLNTMRLGVLRLTAAVAALSAVAVAFGLLWKMGLDNAAAANNDFAASMDRMNRMPINSFSHPADVTKKVTSHSFLGIPWDEITDQPTNSQGWLERHRVAEETAARKDVKNYDPQTGVFHMPKRDSVADVRKKYEAQLAQSKAVMAKKGIAEQAAEMKSAMAQAKAVSAAAGLGDGGDGDPADTYAKGKKGKATKEQKDDAKATNEMASRLLELAHTIRLHGDESEAAAAKDQLLFGDMASDTAKAAGLAIALKQVSAAQRDKAAHDVYGKSFKSLSPSQQQGAELVAMNRLDTARKAAAKVATDYKDKLKELNDELARGRAEVAAVKANNDEDRISLKTFQKPFAQLTDPAHKEYVSAASTVEKNKRAASVNVNDVQFDTGPNPQDARDAMTADVAKAQIELAKAHSTSDEDTISLERYGKAFKDLTDPEIIQGVKDLARYTKDLHAAKADTSGAVFDNGADAAAAKGKTQLDAYRQAMHTLNAAKAEGRNMTDAERFAEVQYGLSLAEVAGLTEDERASLQKMNDAQAVQVVQTQKYIESLKAYRAQMDKIATTGSDIITGGVQHIFEHGFKGIGNTMKTELKNALQGQLLDTLRDKLKSAMSNLLDKGKPKAPTQLAATTQNTSAIASLTQSINALIKQMGGTAPNGPAGTGTGSVGAAAGVAAGLPGSPSWLRSLGTGLSMIPGFANGGYYTGGPAMVGEDGPEMINGRGGGWITPNSAIASATRERDIHLHVTYNGATTADFNPRTTIQHARQLHRHLKTATQG